MPTNKLPLFDFKPIPVEAITPWSDGETKVLPWYALSLGEFQINVGESVLFQYSDEILQYWGTAQTDLKVADYQIAGIAREMLSSAQMGMQTLPDLFEAVAQNYLILDKLGSTGGLEYPEYEATRWLGERAPDTSFFVKHPSVFFLRVKDDIHIHWDNRNRKIEGIPVWTAMQGQFILPVEAFRAECMMFAQHLLDEMLFRILQIERGEFKTQCAVIGFELRKQQRAWQDELLSYFLDKEPDISPACVRSAGSSTPQSGHVSIVMARCGRNEAMDGRPGFCRSFASSGRWPGLI